MSEVKTCFLTTGPISWASARLRAFWIAPYMDDAVAVELYEDKETIIPIADTYIWQKRFNPEFMAEMDVRHWWDCCDPMWWFSPGKVERLLGQIDGIVCATQALADDLKAWCGRDSIVIPDRLELSHYDRQREHGDVQPIRLIWFGLGANRITLAGAWANLARLVANGYDIQLTLFDDSPQKPLGFGDEVPIYYVPWKLHHEVDIISSHDIALLPPYPGPWGDMKSNNKMLTAFACGLPVTTGHDYDELVQMMDPEWREDMAAYGLAHVLEHGDIRASALQWEAAL